MICHSRSRATIFIGDRECAGHSVRMFNSVCQVRCSGLPVCSHNPCPGVAALLGFEIVGDGKRAISMCLLRAHRERESQSLS